MSAREGGRILLTGAAGQVGRELVKALAPLGEVVAPTRQEMDLGVPGSVRAAVRSVRPRWIVNPGAYTAVDKAESEPNIARVVNAEAVAILAEEAHRIGAAVVQFSTDYVFDGANGQPYMETDATGPKSVYGQTKLDGEEALASSGAAHAIFRTGWVFGATGKNFLLTILRMAREREQLKVVADQHGSPTWSRDLAEMTADFVRQCEAASLNDGITEVVRELGGVYHASGTGYTTWFGFAEEIVRQAKLRYPSVRFAEITPISTAEFPTSAQRPANSRLCCARLRERLGWTMRRWPESLSEALSEL